MSNELEVYKGEESYTSSLSNIITECSDELLESWKKAGVVGDAVEDAEKLICPIEGMTDEEYRQVEERVLKIYKECLSQYNLSDEEFLPISMVIDTVQSYNDDLITNIAYLEYVHGPQEYQKDYCEANGIDLDSDEEEYDYNDEIPSFLNGEWSDYIYQYYFQGRELDNYVQYVLDKYRMTYSFEKRDLAYDKTNATALIFRINKEATFLANDAQNVVLPEFINFGFAGYSDFVNFHEEFDLSDRLLGGGAL